MLLPVGMNSDVLRMMSLVLPDPGVEDPERVFTAGLDGPGPAGAGSAPGDGFITTPPSRTFVGPRWLAAQRLLCHQNRAADPIRPLVAHAGHGSAPADAIHGASPGPVGEALRSS